MSTEDLFNPVSDNDEGPLNPLPCDRWVARSCLQKAIRRGEADVAVRALANLFLHDPKSIWRHLTIIALEDVGVANLDILRSIVAAKHEQLDRRAQGSLWGTFVKLAEQLAGSEHCQAICDLLLRAENDPSVEREPIIDAGAERWAELLYDHKRPMQQQAISALSFGGFTDAAVPADPQAVFEISSENGHISEVTALAQSAWKLSRNPMALLLPIVWRRWCERPQRTIRDDRLPTAQWIDGVPEYGLDQFTRIGKSVIRELTRQDTDLQRILSASGIARDQWPRAVGDLVFLIEGGPCVRRTIWEEAERLRRPARWLQGTALLGKLIGPASEYLAAKVQKLSEFRRQLFHRSR